MQKILKSLKALFLIILVVGVAVAGCYAYLMWKVSTAADEFAREISPFAAMRYQAVHIDLLQSEVGLRDVAFTPVGMNGDITVDAMTLRAPSFGFILELENKLAKGELPQSFNIDIRGLDIDLASGYMQEWGRLAADVQQQAGQSYETLGCGELEYFSIADIRKMGYSSLSSDLSLQYYFDATDQALNFDLQSRTQQMADMDMSVIIQVATNNLNVQTLVFAQPKLKRVETRFKDTGYNQRRNRYCAKLNDEPVDQYRERYRQLLMTQLQQDGWTVPEALLASYDTFNNPSGSMYVRMDFPRGFGMQSMALLQSPSDIIDALSPYVEFNAKPVSLDGVSWAEPDPEVERLRQALTGELPSEALAQADAPEEVVTQQRRKVREPEKRKSFKPVQLSVLSQHVGEQVVLYTYFGRVVEGKLVKVTDSIITVEHRLVDGRGTATYPIARDKIEIAQLYY